MIRTLWVGINLVIVTAVLAMVVLIAALLRVRGHGVYDWAARTWAARVLRASGVELEVEGLENVRLDQPQIFASNHVSWYDVFALAVAIPKRYRFVAKKELGWIPLFGTAWKAAGHISVDRSDRAAAIRSLDEAGRLLKQDNSSVVIFPEGTRSRDGRLQPFKKGAFMLALHTGVDIVPVAVLGTRHILPKGAWRVRSGRIIVRFGEAVRVSNYSEATRDTLMADVRARIARMLEAPAHGTMRKHAS
ncbi:MAG TPA: lysophospholipid acyltransferase family protein [Longimicrobiales bacterium]